MPPELSRLFICQTIGWIAFFSTTLFFTDFIAQVCVFFAFCCCLIFLITDQKHIISRFLLVFRESRFILVIL